MKQFVDKNGLIIFLEETDNRFEPNGKIIRSAEMRQQLLDFNYDDILHFETELSDAAAIVGVAICGVTLLGQS